MIFKASYDTTTKVVTPIATIFVVLSLFPIYMLTLKEVHWQVYILFPILMIAILLLSVAFAPKYYAFEGREILINRLLMPPVKIGLNQIISIEAVSGKSLRGSVRIFGSGAFLGYYGRFANKTFGRMIWYATNLKNGVLIVTQNNKKYLITPDEQEQFINMVKKDI